MVNINKKGKSSPVINIIKNLKKSSIEEGIKYLSPSTLMLYVENDFGNPKLQKIFDKLNVKYKLFNGMIFINYFEIVKSKLFSEIKRVFKEEIITVLGLTETFSIEKDLITFDKLESGTILNHKFTKFLIDIDVFENELHIIVKKIYVNDKKLFLKALKSNL